MANLPITSFNAGEFTPKIAERIDTEKYQSGCKHLENFLPLIYGTAERRPGTIFVAASYIKGQFVRLIPFVYSSTIAYLTEMGDEYERFFYDDAVIEAIDSPYTTEQLFQVQFQQIADVVRKTHPSHKPRKLSRTSAETFEIAEIDFRRGPFLTRNDLLDPDNLNPTELSCTATLVGSYGALTADAGIFLDGHAGALFKLVHPRTTTVSSGTMTSTNTGVICQPIDIKGGWGFIAHGSWTGTIIIERNENNAGWETFRTYISGNPADLNVNISFTENEDSVQYRASVSEHATSSTIKCEITCNNSTQEGIVRIISVSDAKHATCLVLSKLASTSATKRWFEGAWSDLRGYPATLTFFEDRCCYAGGISNSDRVEAEVVDYPTLRSLPI